MATCEEIFGNSDESEEEFIGFTRSEIDPESDTESLGDSDISFSDSGSESSESEDENNAEEGDQWSRNLRNVAVAPFVKPTCPVNILPAESTALDFFNLVFPQNVLELIVLETNRNAEQKQAKAGVVDKNWTPVNTDDIKAYLAIRFIHGIKTLPSERHYWSNNDILRVRKVQNIMPRNRYLKINQYLHFNDSTTAFPREHDNHDKLHLIRPLITRLSETFSSQYMPNCENAIDEGLVKFKGRLGFKQYMPMKSTKRGIKVWIRADSTSHFVSRFQVYTRKPQNGQEHGLRERVGRELSLQIL